MNVTPEQAQSGGINQPAMAFHKGTEGILVVPLSVASEQFVISFHRQPYIGTRSKRKPDKDLWARQLGPDSQVHTLTARSYLRYQLNHRFGVTGASV